MIKLLTIDNRNKVLEHTITPTIFPDNTSQVWKLPHWVEENNSFKIVWNFEQEREIIDVSSLILLLPFNSYKHLHIPYLPYGRQDKDINNNATFNLNTFAHIINSLNINYITSIDVHNVKQTTSLIRNFKNITVSEIHSELIRNLTSDYIIFPDQGASERYNLSGLSSLTCVKERDQLTGIIKNVRVVLKHNSNIKMGQKFLIIDDICDGGATFISVAKALRKIEPNITVNLFVTHGIFSKGNKLEGIDQIFTTNSLLKNNESEFKV